MDNGNKLFAGGVAVAVAVAILLFSLSGGDEKGGDGANLGCTLGASGVAAVADGLLKNKRASAIVAIVGGPASGFACNAAIDTLANKPDDPVELTIADGGEGTVVQSVTGSELSMPVPPVDPRFQRGLDCLPWRAQLLHQACVEGRLEPPGR